MVCLVPLALQDFSVDALRYLAFFSYFSLQLAQLVLVCFSDRRPSTAKPVSVKVRDP